MDADFESSRDPNSSQSHLVSTKPEHESLSPRGWSVGASWTAAPLANASGCYKPIVEQDTKVPGINVRCDNGDDQTEGWQHSRSHAPAISSTRMKRFLQTSLDDLQEFWKKTKNDWQSLIDFLQDSWFLEIGACITALLLFIAEIVLLRGFEKHQIDAWPWNWSLNSAVALITTFIEANLIFAITSCLGQMKWLWFSLDQGRMKRLIWVDLIARSNTPLGALSLLLRPTTWK